MALLCHFEIMKRGEEERRKELKLQEKYFVFVGTQVIGMKYNPISKKITVGGNIRFVDVMETLLLDYFILELPRPSYTAVNKIQFETKISMKAWKVGRKKLREDNITLQYTTGFRRIMR